MTVKIETFKHSDINYSFHYNTPALELKTVNGQVHTEYVDPFPCYTHDEAAVRDGLELAMRCFSVGCDVNLFIMPYETPARWNGYCSIDHDWNVEVADNEPRPFDIRIVVAGKRTPLHRAMTRFVVAHEYGHGVEAWIARQMGMKDTSEFRTMYMKLRPSDQYTFSYSGGMWHSSVGELIADDFRLLVTGVEHTHWPHPGFPKPYDVPGLADHWNEWRDKYAVKS